MTSGTFITLLCSKDVRLPVQLQRAMAAEAEAAREARAKVSTLLAMPRPNLHPLSLLFRSSRLKENKKPAVRYVRRLISCRNPPLPSNCDTCRSTHLAQSFFGRLLYFALQTLNSISAEKNSTIIFPVPVDIIQSFISPTPAPTPTPNMDAPIEPPTLVAGKPAAKKLT